MSQNSGGCGCSDKDDYSLKAADLGIAKISTANPSLTGSGATTVLTVPPVEGTIIKSVIIKATGPVTNGMVRLFIKSAAGNTGLYKEIPIPTTPALNNTPTPAPILPTFELCLEGGLKMASQSVLLASTQNAESFNIFAVGLDWVYPNTLPSGCCDLQQDQSNIGVGVASTANPNLDGTGSIVTVFTALAAGNGSRITSITIKAMQSTNEGMVRLFIGPDTSHFSLFKEIYIPQTTQSGFEPAYKVVLDEELYLAKGFLLGASTHLAQSFSVIVEGASWLYPIS